MSHNLQDILAEKHFLATIIQKLPCYVYWKDTNGKYLGCNELVYTLAKGISVVGKTDFELPWHAQAERIREDDLLVLANKQVITVEEEFINASGQGIWFLTYKIPLTDDKDVLLGLLGVSVDITARKIIEAELSAAKQQLELANTFNTEFLANMRREVIGESDKSRTVIEHAIAVRRHLESIIACMPGNVYWTDKNSVYLGCNDNVIKTFGLQSREDFIGMTYERMSEIASWTAGQGNSFKYDDQEVIRTGQPKLNIEEPPITDINGEGHYFLTSRVPLRDENNEITGIVGVSIDITDRKKMEQELLKAKEQAEMANEAKTLFMENMSHDFKTPLNGIFGSIQLLATTPDLPEEVKQIVDLQKKSVERLKKLIDSILDFRRVYSGKIEIKNEELNLLEIIESIAGSLTFQVREKNIDIVIHYPTTVPRYLLGDSYCVSSIILNLMSNAIKFTEQGQVTVQVKLLEKIDQSAIIQIQISDTGKGIPADKLEQIFDRFHRLDLSNQGLTPGHGIGLSVVHELVKKLNGRISVVSELNVGSTFTVELPFEVQSMFVSKWQHNYAHVRVLVVTDTKTTMDILVQQLGENNVRQVASKNILNELLHAVQMQNPFHILIIDDEVTFIEPLTLVKMVTHTQAIPKLMPILATSPNNKEWFDRARTAGFYDFLLKPIFPSELEEKIIDTWERWTLS